jgi:hypothetical protein
MGEYRQSTLYPTYLVSDQDLAGDPNPALSRMSSPFGKLTLLESAQVGGDRM